MKLSRARKGLLVAAAVLVALGGVIAVAPSSSAATTYQFLQFNAWGNVGNKGTTGVADAIARSVLKHRPLGVTLNEMCANQASHLDRQLANYNVRFFRTTTRTCANGAAFGNAVVYPSAPRATSATYSLPRGSAGLETRGMVCVHIARPDVVMCSVHLAVGSSAAARSARNAQAARVNAIGASWARTVPTFIGGDFNATPTDDALDNLYRPAWGGGAHGSFNEGNRCCFRRGAGTLDQGSKKIDYGWLSTRWTPVGESTARSGAKPGGGRYSDHKLLFVTARL